MNWFAKLEKMKKELEDTVSLERRKLLMEQELVSFKLDNLGKKIGELSVLEDELESLKKEKEALRKQEEERLSKKSFLTDIESRIKKLKEADDSLAKKGKYTEIKLSLLDDPEPFCPICHKEMRFDEKIRVKNKVLERDRMEKDLLARNKEQLTRLSQKREDTKNQIKDLDRSLLGKTVVFQRIEELRKKIEDTKKEALKFRELEKREEDIEKALNDKSYAEVAQKVLKEINKEIKESL